MSMIALPTMALRKHSHCYWETRSKVKGQHDGATQNNQTQRQKYIIKLSSIMDFVCNQYIWTSFNDCDDICDPK